MEWSDETLTPELRAKARDAMHRPDVRAKLSALRKGRQQHPNTIEACRRLGQRPKSEEWKRGQSERSKKMWENPEAYGLAPRRKWKERELAMIGTDSDPAVAEALGLPVAVVRYKRGLLGILRLTPWREQELALLGTAPDSELAGTVGRSPSAIRQMRKKLRIPAFDPRPWTDQELALLGTVSDRELGTKFGRSQSCIYKKRESLGIPAFVQRWSKAEIALLGTDTDERIAMLLDRTEIAVKVKREKSKIPVYR